MRFAKLQHKLVSFCEAADLLKSQLEAMVEVLDPSIAEISKCNKNIGATLLNMVKSSQNLMKNVSVTLDDLKDSAAETDTDELTQLPDPEINRSSTSMSNECLPDPSEIDIPDHPKNTPDYPKDTFIKHLNDELEAKYNEIEQKSLAITALTEQVEQKDKVIR